MSPEPCQWIRELRVEDIPADALEEARLCLLDTLGVTAAGGQTRLAAIMSGFVRTQMPGDTPLLFTDGSASTVGAALYGAAATDALDAHDGQVLTKGHVGATVIPALLALPGIDEVDGGTLLMLVTLGYEIGTRAGIALHASAPDYHTSGAWNALGAAAVAGRFFDLSMSQIQEALGTAEFYGPRSQMMRCIDHPTMVKDGSAWGALGGISAALLAREGFTGAPAVTLAAKEAGGIWEDLGSTWLIQRQYRKPHPVCRWAQPAIEAVLSLRDRLPASPEAIREIRVRTFHEAQRLAVTHPDSTEQAQYSLPWPVACAAIGGTVSAFDVSEAGLGDSGRRALSARIRVVEDETFNRRFPAERWAAVDVELDSGQVLKSEPHQARGDYQAPLSRSELIAKFHDLADPCLGRTRAAQIRESIDSLDHDTTAAGLVRLTGGA
ncbi:MAG: MmgE/PrpD family protein [Ectothiorhodospiraceae bacterium]|jgi:2-methylcitrate dehydratase PrpD